MSQPLWSHSASALAVLLEKKEISSREATLAHLEQIARHDADLHAFTEVFREDALKAADAADKARAAGEVPSRLLGLPVSVKECFDIAGKPTTLGVPSRQKNLASRDAALVEHLRLMGAVILGRTNIPQLLLSYESRNPIWGAVKNPFALDRTPGGSSGGEAAALAAGLSPFGLGSDLGGSIRVPAHFTGTAGLKPTLDRIPARGCQTGLPGQEVVRGMPGPMARTSRDLALWFSTLDPQWMAKADGRVPPLPWIDPAQIEVAKLRVGVVQPGPFFVAPSAAIARSIEDAGNLFRAAGCDVVPFEIPDVVGLYALQASAISSDGGAVINGALSGNATDPVFQALLANFRRGRGMRAVASMVLKRRGDPLVSEVIGRMGKRPVQELWSLTALTRATRQTFLDAMAKERIDLLLCPPFATPAAQHTTTAEFMPAGAYSSIFNVLQLPAGVLPFTTVRESETARPASASALDKMAAGIDLNSAGLPIGVQLIGRPWEEHLVLAAMIELEGRARASPEFPLTPIAPRPAATLAKS
jgi:fatty acid amide hydrolase